jgi:hypothetical protein
VRDPACGGRVAGVGRAAAADVQSHRDLEARIALDQHRVAAALAGQRARPIGRDVVIDPRHVLADDLRLAAYDPLHLEAERALRALVEGPHLGGVDRALVRHAASIRARSSVGANAGWSSS